jgi:uncharacterized C2H2 Zn-finger protein
VNSPEAILNNKRAVDVESGTPSEPPPASSAPQELNDPRPRSAGGSTLVDPPATSGTGRVKKPKSNRVLHCPRCGGNRTQRVSRGTEPPQPARAHALYVQWGFLSLVLVAAACAPVVALGERGYWDVIVRLMGDATTVEGMPAAAANPLADVALLALILGIPAVTYFASFRRRIIELRWAEDLQFSRRVTQWEHSIHCNRCGHVFTSSQASESSVILPEKLSDALGRK